MKVKNGTDKKIMFKYNIQNQIRWKVYEKIDIKKSTLSTGLNHLRHCQSGIRARNLAINKIACQQT